MPEDPNNIDQWSYLLRGLAFSLLSALLITSTFIIGKQLNITIAEGARGFAFNADLGLLTNLVEIGTRPAIDRGNVVGAILPPAGAEAAVGDPGRPRSRAGGADSGRAAIVLAVLLVGP